ncbi:MAG: heme exporter protein CcmB [bacterium]|nr:MAG: heme exporter protein CcmB [bacterium]
MVKRSLSFIHKAYIVFLKDLHVEFRSRYAVNAIFLFAITTLTAISFSIGPIRLRSEILAPLLWIILFFSSMSGLAHIFVREEEQQTADTLRLLTSPNSIFLGKWLFNIILLFSLEVLIIPVFLAMMGVQVDSPGTFLLIIFIGSIGLASVATLIAAIISQASAKGALFAVLSFPISLPVLISGIHGTQLAMDGGTFKEAISDIQILFSFSIVIVTLSLLLFEFIWRK